MDPCRRSAYKQHRERNDLLTGSGAGSQAKQTQKHDSSSRQKTNGAHLLKEGVEAMLAPEEERGRPLRTPPTPAPAKAHIFLHARLLRGSDSVPVDRYPKPHVRASLLSE